MSACIVSLKGLAFVLRKKHNSYHPDLTRKVMPRTGKAARHTRIVVAGFEPALSGLLV